MIRTLRCLEGRSPPLNRSVSRLRAVLRARKGALAREAVEVRVIIIISVHNHMVDGRMLVVRVIVTVRQEHRLRPRAGVSLLRRIMVLHMQRVTMRPRCRGIVNRPMVMMIHIPHGMQIRAIRRLIVTSRGSKMMIFSHAMLATDMIATVAGADGRVDDSMTSIAIMSLLYC